MRILIKVTKEILEKSMYCDSLKKYCDSFESWLDKDFRSANCAISLAVRELLPHAITNYEAIDIFDDWANQYFINPTWRIKLPQNAQDFITLFDNLSAKDRLNLPEISFEIDVPDEVIESIGISEAERIISNSLTMEKV